MTIFDISTYLRIIWTTVTQNVQKKPLKLRLNSPGVRYKNTQILLAGHRLKTSNGGEAIFVQKERFGSRASAFPVQRTGEGKTPEWLWRSVTVEFLKTVACARV